ncbi:MAG: RNA polymerase sigma factor [Defluviitaleaceae bacterium]|nr:RNA polymerase sigma factor [Defluviitaleaceae bacterium]
MDELERIFEENHKTIYKICYTYMKTAAETEDCVQEAFVKLITSGKKFESKEHEKAWLIRTATNICKNILRHWWQKRENIENHHLSENFENDDTLAVVLDLPTKYKTVVYLYYYEGYDSTEIAKILQKPNSTIRNHLHEARKILKEAIQ